MVDPLDLPGLADVWCRLHRQARFHPSFDLSSWKWALDLVSKQVNVETRRRGAMVVPCVAGRWSVVVDEAGRVLPCEPLGEVMGDLKDFDFRLPALIASPRARAVVDRIRRERCHCDWRCLVPLNLAFHPPGYPRLLIRLLANRVGPGGRFRSERHP